ncbi:dnaJ-like subfamily C member 10, partial [Silurus asotus]
EDYYKLLGISREASTREIRQAFKKLALTMHPDKNPNDATAHEKFLTINRAYEVLKDEDLRKKYDKYGEKGLQDEQQGGRYESWNFYRYDFGIYDEDAEVITLDRGDFEVVCYFIFVIFHTVFVWTLLKFGTVLLFPCFQNPEKYYGDRSKASLTKFAMQFVTTKVTELWQGNVFTEIDQAFAARIGWLISFCADTGDCLESQTRQKLAGMLSGLVKVGWMDCTLHPDLCESFKITTSKTALFPPGSSLAQEGSVLVRP